MSAKVQVLMSTYNGEKYLAEQLDSILRQKDVDVSLLIRDDGSSDATVSILQAYCEKDPRIRWYSGENLKSAGSFFDLAKNAGEADYYAFSDQDDVWAADKLASGVKALQTRNDAILQLYYCNLAVVDENLHFLGLLHRNIKRTDHRYGVLAEYYAAGCTMVFNRKARETYIANLPQGGIMHDAWMEIVCQFLGEVTYDPAAHIQYRQHANNVIGVATSPGQRIARKIRRLLSPDKQPRYEFAKVISRDLAGALSEADLREVQKIVTYKDSLSHWLRLLFDRRIQCSSLRDGAKFRILILLRRI